MISHLFFEGSEWFSNAKSLLYSGINLSFKWLSIFIVQQLFLISLCIVYSVPPFFTFCVSSYLKCDIWKGHQVVVFNLLWESLSFNFTIQSLMLNVINDIFGFESSVWLWSNCYHMGKLWADFPQKPLCPLVVVVDESETNMSVSTLSQWYIYSICIYLCEVAFLFLSAAKIKYWKKCGLRITFGTLYHKVLNQKFKRKWSIVNLFAAVKCLLVDISNKLSSTYCSCLAHSF